ncbi:hypothetical protein ACFQX7_20275 [Luedemannella flava]
MARQVIVDHRAGPDGLCTLCRPAEVTPCPARRIAVTAKRLDAKRSGRLQLRLQELVMPVVVPRVFERATAWLYDYTPERLSGGA